MFLRRIALILGRLPTTEASAALAGVSLADARTALGILVAHGVLETDPDGQVLFRRHSGARSHPGGPV